MAMINLFDIQKPMGRKEYFFSFLIRISSIIIISALVLVAISFPQYIVNGQRMLLMHPLNGYKEICS